MISNSNIFLQKFKNLLFEEHLNKECSYIDNDVYNSKKSTVKSQINSNKNGFDLSYNIKKDNDATIINSKDISKKKKLIHFKKIFCQSSNLNMNCLNCSMVDFKKSHKFTSSQVVFNTNIESEINEPIFFNDNITYETKDINNKEYSNSVSYDNHMNEIDKIENNKFDNIFTNEQIHMSWDELMQEAKMYGIGLVCPKMCYNNFNDKFYPLLDPLHSTEVSIIDAQQNFHKKVVKKNKKYKISKEHDIFNINMGQIKIVQNENINISNRNADYITHIDEKSNEFDATKFNSVDNEKFLINFGKLKHQGWYWGPIGWEDAEEILKNKSDGCFIVRDSSDDRYILSLSFRAQNSTHHTRIEHFKGMFSFSSQPRSLAATTIVEFIDSAIRNSSDGRFLYFLRPQAPGLPPAPVRLLYPISRFSCVASLQHMCRFIIVNCIRRDHINLLPIPQRIKNYLNQTQYYVEDVSNELFL